MRPAQSKRLKRFKKTKTRGHFSLKKLLLLLFVFVVLFILYRRSIHFGALSKLTVVMPDVNGDVIVTTFDKKAEEITRIELPGDTLVTLSRELGEWRLKSVWQLGINEKVGGKLLAETVTKNFKFPIFAWSETGGLGLTQEDLLSKIKAIFYPYDTNLGFGDRLTLAIFSLGVRNANRVEIDLSKTDYLNYTKLKDGVEGYTISGRMPQNLIVVFAEPTMAEKGIRIILKNNSGIKNLSSEVAGVLESLGGKVTANIEGK